MARLHEYQGKALLRARGVETPEGAAVRTPDEAAAVATRLGGRVVVKVQAWTTSRKAQGGVRFADTPAEARAAAADMLGMTFGNFPVEEVLVERCLDIRHELFISLTIDDAAQAPLLLLDVRGGSGIEDRAATVARIPLDVESGVDPARLRAELATSSIDASSHEDLVRAVSTIVDLARDVEARSFEV
ncbi:MAG: acetate--CoA ligase family protein, partial [Phycisphaerales bacterium]|nr:acetate--CoA ligase family protein [Phycisphaerales bacterium]